MNTARAADFFNSSYCERRYAERSFNSLGQVRIQSITELERKQWQFAALNEDGEVDRAAMPMTGPRLIVLTVVDEEGNRVFVDSDAGKLAEMDAGIIGGLVDWIMAHCEIDSSLENEVGN